MSRQGDERTWFLGNERNWDDRAKAHMSGNYSGVNDLVADPRAISAELAQDIGLLGDLTGRHVVHLQCHVGTDTISLARCGAARVVGVDLSATSLNYARTLAARAGADISTSTPTSTTRAPP